MNESYTRCFELKSDPLWKKLNEYQIDDLESGLTFSERLARDNGWSRNYAKKVVEEYKRFIFLAMRSGHTVTPSDSVDQVWHQHLTYTKSYWDDLCKDVLNSELHHGPTKGGKHEKVKYRDLYIKTLASYEKFFDQLPPTDVWPSPEDRFGRDLQFRRINKLQNWVIPKPSWLLSFPNSRYTAATAVFILPAFAALWNPLVWQGPAFLGLYVFLLLLSISALVFLRISNRHPNPPTNLQPSDLNPTEAAMLFGDSQRAVSCALVELQQKDAIKVHQNEVSPYLNIDRAKSDHRLGSILLTSVRKIGSQNLQEIRTAAKPALVEIQEKLETLGLFTSRRFRSLQAIAACSVMGSIMSFGIVKIITGISRGKPVLFLVGLEILSAVILLCFILSIKKKTNSGLNFSLKMKREFQSDKGSKLKTGSSSHDNLLLWSTAIIGVTSLHSTDFAEIPVFTTQKTNSIFGSGDFDGGSGCGGGGCGGGCGGCGGCGG